MKRVVCLLFVCFPFLVFSQNYWLQQGSDIDGVVSGDQSGYSVSINYVGDRIIIGSPANDDNGLNSGHVRVFEWDGINFTQLGLDIVGDSVGDWSGWSVSMNASGNKIVIGAPWNDNNGLNSGQVRVFEWDGNNWAQQGQDIDGEAAGDESGYSVKMNNIGDRIAVGAPENDGNNSNSGQARVFEWDGNNWIQLGQDINGATGGNYFGSSVAMNVNGSRVAVGAPNHGNSLISAPFSGHVRVYEWNGTNWFQLGQDIYGEAANDHSGRAVTMNGSGNRLVIGASNNDGNGLEAGHVRVFEWDGNNWIQLGQDIDGEAANDRFGLSVAFNEIGDQIVVGAPKNDDNGLNSGQVRVYEWDGNSWSQQGQEINGEAADDESGFSVGLNSAGDRVVISSYKNSFEYWSYKNI